jgi:hypothetical protein
MKNYFFIASSGSVLGRQPQPLTSGFAKAGIISLDSNMLHPNLWLVASV